MGIETGGAEPLHPDFELLRAGLAASRQAAASLQAGAGARASQDRFEALLRLFGDRAAQASDQAALRGSFDPRLAGDAPDAPQT